jgi:threonine aldolase
MGPHATPRTIGPRTFASDNAAGALPEAIAALAAANVGGTPAYGDDPWTRSAIQSIQELFDCPAQVGFCWGGTGANVVALGSVLKRHQSVICSEQAHINQDECGAPEALLGVKLVDLPTEDAKLRPEHIVAAASVGVGSEHHVQPGVVSITQSTESGTLYQPAEIAAIAEVTHDHGMLLHLDGARLANAAAALGVSVSAITSEVGVDVVSMGGTKAGMVFGEAVVFLDERLGGEFRFVRKQLAQLPSKMRFISAQFEAILKDSTWISAASHANQMAARLASGAAKIDGVTLRRHPEVNSVFATLDRDVIAKLQAWSFFWDWDESINEVRWMTSFDTTEADVDRFLAGVRAAVAGERLG